MKATPTIVAACAWLAAAPAWADPALDLASSVELIVDGAPAGLEDALRAEVAALGAEDAAEMALGRIALSMAELSEGAEFPTTRMVMQDLHREFVTGALGPDSAAVRALDAADPMIAEIAPGLGITEQDLGWGGWLEIVRQEQPEGSPRDLAIDPDAYAAAVAGFVETWEESTDVERMFLARIDAWAAGVALAWPGLDAAEREAVSHAVLRDDIPPVRAFEAVTGATDAIDWLAGLHVGLTDAEKAAHPALAAYLTEGGMSGAMAPLLAEREAMVASAVAMAELSTLNTMMNLNTWLQFGGEAGGVLGGLE